MSFINKEVANISDLLYEYPLTQGQAAIWFYYKSVPESVAYNLAGAVAIPWDADLEALQRAFQKVAEHHPMLRTLFAAKHGEPVQRVFSSLEMAFQIHDTSKWDVLQLNDHLEEEVYRPFDLERGPTWRVVVYQRAPISGENEGNAHRDNLVLLVLHHIIVDLWSIAILMSEVASVYRQDTRDAPASLKSPRTSYADHVQKEFERLAGPEAERSWDYWRSTLAGEIAPLNLPLDRPRQPVSTGHGAVQSIHLDKHLSDELQALAENEHVPLYAILLAAFEVLLNRYTGQNDVLVGFPKAGRSPSTVRVVGYFVNQTVVRTNFSENPGFSDLLRGVQKSLEEGAKHDWYPFSLLVQRLQPQRDLSRSPLIQVVFSWQQAPRLIPQHDFGSFVLGQGGRSVELDGVFLRSFHLPYRVAPFDLMMLAAQAPDGLAVTIEYSNDLFEAGTIARMAACYRTLLESVVANPMLPVSDINILPESERKKLLESWNDTAAPYPSQACLHQLFEQQVEWTPDVVAVASGEGQVTYRQLNLQANQLAHFLQEQGIGPDRLVATCMEPSVEMITAILGILKAGGAYLPLDSNNPRERLAFMLADANPALLLTNQAVCPHLPEFSGPLFLMDAEEDRLRSQPQTNPSINLTPDHLAYVIYTSGSTGRPKGVALAHRGVVNLLADFQRRRAIQPGEACSWWTSSGFDVSVYEIFSPIIAGGSLHVIPEKLRLDAPNLFGWLNTHRVCSAYLPPFFLEEFAAWLKNHPGASFLHRLLVGVEPIPEPLLIKILSRIPSLTIINGYGPTETTICSTLYELEPSHACTGNTPIGRPVANTKVYLLDRALQPVPVGVVGEIFIGGVGLAHGYLNRPDLTAQRFLDSPFCSGERLYRTGDRARYLPDGNLVFVGRSDTQVKLHGVRIEVGEIEAILVQQPGVKQAVVRLYEQEAGGKHLVAYITTSEDISPAPEALRQQLARRLPLSMVPSTYVIMDAFPLTPSGKVNRKALTVPERLKIREEGVSQEPRNEIEQKLVSIWEQVLGVEQVSTGDNFFELGGDSILSLQVVARAAEAGMYMKPHHVFQAPTIAELAALVGLVEPVRISVEEDAGPGAIPLTPIQRWFFEQNFSSPEQWNQALMFITPQPLDPIHLRPAVSALLRQHDALRLRFNKEPSGWQQSLGEPGEEIPFEVIDLSDLAEAEQLDAIEKQAVARQDSLDLSAGPLIRVVYFTSGASLPGRLLIVIHHLVVDGVSWRILLEDLQRAYRQHEREGSIQLPSKTTAFHTWARRLADYAGSADLSQEVDFWQGMVESLRQMRSGDPLISDRISIQRNTEASARRVSVSLGREETRALTYKAYEAYGTETNELLLTALARAIQRWTGSETLWVDLESHGRQEVFDGIDLSRTVGWFTTLYPAHFELPRDAGLDQSIICIKEQLRQIPNHGFGYGLLRYLSRDSKPRELLKANSAAPISFNYLGHLPETSADDLFFDLAPETVGYQRSPDARRTHLIEINAAIQHRELQVDWIYSVQVHAEEMIERVAGYFIAELRDLIAHCQSLETVRYTPSDFPDAGLSQEELDAICSITTGSKAVASKRNLDAIYPLSPMQQGMVFHTLYSPESGAYIVQIAFIIDGNLDVSAFVRAWQQVLKRHANLRTSFVWQGLEQALQVVHTEVDLPFERQDWRDASEAEQQSRLERLLTAERQCGFNLSVPPLLRLDLLQTGGNTYRIVFSHHHAVLDGWSVSLLFKEVFALYNAFIRDKYLALPPARPYQDYISWLGAQDLTAAEAFWRTELKGFVPINLSRIQPTSSPPTGASCPAEQKLRLSIEMTAGLKSIARRQHLTLSTLVEGAWAILLSQTLRREDVLFGLTISGRPPGLPGSQAMMGLFINTLPLRVHVNLQSNLYEWLHQLQAKVIKIQQYDYSPLSRIQAWSETPHPSHLFDTFLVFENYPALSHVQEWFSGLRIGNIRSVEQSTYPLTVAATPGEQFSLRILYDPALFEPSAVRSLIDHLHELFKRMLADPNQSLAELFAAAPFGLDGTNRRSSRTKIASLPTNPSTIDQRLLDLVPRKDSITRGETDIPPNSPLERYLVQQWKRQLKIDRAGVFDNFFQLGGDSLKGAICTYQLQNAMDETIPIAAIFEAPTISEYARYLEQEFPAGVSRLLGIPISAPKSVEPAVRPEMIVPIQPGGSRTPLFCIHPAGGIIFPYYALAAYLDKEQPVYGIQDPDLYEDQPASKSIESMATGYIEAIEKIQPEGPYNLMGWSAGGVIAYEMARQLSRQGQMVANLIMLDTRAPVPASTGYARSLQKGWLSRFSLRTRELTGRIKGLRAAIRPVIRYIRSGLFLIAASSGQENTSPGDQPTLGDLLGWVGLDTWRAYLLKGETEVASTISQEKSLLLIKMPAVRKILKLVREHRRLARRYTAERYQGKIVLFRAVGDGSERESAEDMAAGWENLAENGVDTHAIRANHVALFVKPYIEILAHELSTCLRKEQ